MRARNTRVAVHISRKHIYIYLYLTLERERVRAVEYARLADMTNILEINPDKPSSPHLPSLPPSTQDACTRYCIARQYSPRMSSFYGGEGENLKKWKKNIYISNGK